MHLKIAIAPFSYVLLNKSSLERKDVEGSLKKLGAPSKHFVFSTTTTQKVGLWANLACVLRILASVFFFFFF